MYLEEAEEIFAYWEDAPPVYQVASIIAQMLGWKPRRSVKTGPVQAANLNDLMLSGVFGSAPAGVADEFAELARMGRGV